MSVPSLDDLTLNPELLSEIETTSLAIEDCFCRHYVNGRIERLRTIQQLLFEFQITTWAIPLKPQETSDNTRTNQ